MFLSVFWLFCRMNAARSSGRSWVDLPTVWRDPNTPQRERERERMLALLVEDGTVLKQRHVTAHA